MKRSEMLKLIMNTFHEGMTYKEKMLSGISEEQAEKLLSAIEKVGMLPPTRDVIIEGHACDENSWEPEFPFKDDVSKV